MSIQVKLTVEPAGDVGLVDDFHRCIQRDFRKQAGDILGVEPHATVTDTHAHTVRPVSAVNQVARDPQA